jgi:predicted glutamine amidotransferase
MGQFWGLSINDDNLVSCAVRKHASRISKCAVDTGSFGLGYYSRGELLQRVEPRCQGEPLDVLRMVETTRADLVIMHARSQGGVEPAKREDIHPFRFKEWLFAHNGKIEGFLEIKERLLEAIPSFIGRNIKGETDSELVFHLFLSFLYDSGVLSRPEADISAVGDALVRTFATVDEFAHICNKPISKASVIVSDGYSMVVGSRGIPVDYTLIDGIDDCDRCRTSVRPGDTVSPQVDHEDARAVLVCSCKTSADASCYTKLEDNTVLLVSKNQEISIRAFG